MDLEDHLVPTPLCALLFLFLIVSADTAIILRIMKARKLNYSCWGWNGARETYLQVFLCSLMLRVVFCLKNVTQEDSEVSFSEVQHTCN